LAASTEEQHFMLNDILLLQRIDHEEAILYFFYKDSSSNPASGHCPPNSEISLSEFDDGISTGNNF
jgi:hypothetical protein